MKKVLFTATVDSHILQFHLPYLKMFKANGYEVHVATNGNEKIPYCDVKHVISFERSPLKKENLVAIKELKNIIDKEQFDIIHTHTPMGSVVTRIAAKGARKKYGTRVMYTAHGFHFFKGAPLKNWLMFYPVEKYLSKYTDDLITINNEDYELAKNKMKAKNIHFVFGVGVDEDRFSKTILNEEKNKLRQELNINENDFVMIYPAELSNRKNQVMLIDVVEKLIKQDKNIKLLLPGIDSLEGRLQNIVKEKKLENNIYFLGYRNDIDKLLKISNILVSAATQEGLPVNLMEAIASDLPIVATNCRGNRDLVQNGKNGYIVEIDDVNDMVDKINKIKNNIEKIDYKTNVKEELEKISLKNISKQMAIIYGIDNK